MAAQIPDYEQAGELKIGQVGIANLRIRNLDVDKLNSNAERCTRLKIIRTGAVILDFGGLTNAP